VSSAEAKRLEELMLKATAALTPDEGLELGMLFFSLCLTYRQMAEELEALMSMDERTKTDPETLN
jgi:hypothetical protein